MRAIILAAGRGKRLGDLTEECPKGLIRLNGKPLIEWQFEALQGAGIKEVGIVVGHMSEKFTYPQVTYFKNEEWSKTNMVSSLLCARSWLEADTCIVSYSDIVYPEETVSKLMNVEGDITITYNTKWRSLWEERFKDPLSDAETFKINDHGLLVDIGNKTNDISSIQGQYMGLLKFTKTGWKAINGFLQKSKLLTDKIDMTSLLQSLLKNGIQINTVPIYGKWHEIDTLRDIELFDLLKI